LRIDNILYYILIVFLFIGCSYTFSLSVFGDVETIYIPFVDNKTSREDISIIVYNKLIEYIKKNYPSLVISNNKDKSDLIIETIVEEYFRDVSEYTQEGDVERYKVVLKIKYKIYKKGKKILNKEIISEGYYTPEEIEQKAIEESIQQSFNRVFSSLENNW